MPFRSLSRLAHGAIKDAIERACSFVPHRKLGTWIAPSVTMLTQREPPQIIDRLLRERYPAHALRAPHGRPQVLKNLILIAIKGRRQHRFSTDVCLVSWEDLFVVRSKRNSTIHTSRYLKDISKSTLIETSSK